MNTRITPAALGTILSVWAHPDDETYLAAGVMAAAADHRQRVVCVSATAGEHGTGDPQTWPPLRLGRRRTWEAAAAMAVLGVAEHRILGFPDGALADHDAEGLAAIGRLLDDVRPETILTFGADGITFHPDHVAVSRWVTAAWEQRGRPCRLLYAASTPEHLARFGPLYEDLGTYMTDERPTGTPGDQLTVHVHVDGWQLDRKIAALAALASQTGELMASVDQDTFTAAIAEEAFVDATSVVASASTAGPGTRGSEPAAGDGPPAVLIRPIRDADVESIVALSLRAWEPVFDSIDNTVGPAIFSYFYDGDWRAHQASDVRRACSTFLVSVAEHDGRVVGFTAVDLPSDGVEGEIYMVAVDPDCQGTGIGTQLTLAAVDQIRRAGKRAAVVGTGGDPGHAAARATYRKAGFTPWPSQHFYLLLDERNDS